jgi:methionyl-tRNA synthetase
MSKSFYITTAIDYVNGHPHLGHAYEKIVADVIARSRQSRGEDVYFLTGLDEHGQKVQQAAAAEGKTPEAYCDELAEVFKTFATRLDLSNTDFIRTTDPRHQKVVQTILSALEKKGHFYKKMYKGYYSTKEETFLTEKDRGEDGKFDASYGEVAELEETNYYFKLSEHQGWLLDYIEKNPVFIQPPERRNEILGFLRTNKLEDLCISRPISRLNWGIPIPFDPNFVTYVWFDALVNYVSAPASKGDPGLEFLEQGVAGGVAAWPADVHVIGKDIVKFHAVYWPIMLKAMELPLPKQILVHGWWQKDGQKLSKSTGNVVDPIAVINEWGVDAFRYYLLRELDIGPDGNWTDSGLRDRYSSALANGLGNLMNRSLAMLKRYRNGIVPAISNDLASAAAEAVEKTQALLQQSHLQEALEAIWVLVNRANKFIEETAPFKIAKDPAQAERLDQILYSLLEACRVLAVLLWPFLPGTAVKMYSQLGLKDSPDRIASAGWGKLIPGSAVGEPVPLFPRKDQ